MTSESKILTVSYGTFSCTLEGFEDPFNTMKAVAEYFRDLASEDRYFGSEPPVPDAAMLHRIAEREVQRMVEARVQDHGVFLRRQGAEGATPAASPAPLPSVAPAPPAALTDTTARPADDTPVRHQMAETVPMGAESGAQDDESVPSLHDMIPGGVAAKLARIRQSVNAVPVAPVLTPDTLAAFASPAETPYDAPALGDDTDLADGGLPDAADAQPSAEAFASDADIYDGLGVADVTGYPMDDEGEVDSTEVEDALSRLLSLSDEIATDDEIAELNALSGAGATDAEDPVLDDNEAASDHDETAGFDTTPALDTDPVPDAVAATDAETDADLSAEEEVEIWLAEVARNDDAEADDTAYDDAEADAVGTEALSGGATIDADDADDTGLASAFDDPDSVPSDLWMPDEIFADSETADRPALSAAFDDDLSDDQPETTPPAAPEALVLSPALLLTDTVEEDADAPLSRAEAIDSLPEDQPEAVDADLAATLADAPTTPAIEQADAAAKTGKPRRSNSRMIRSRLVGEDDTPANDHVAAEDDEVARLLRQADDEMADVDNRRRLSAIAHLKAAVAATEAERAVTGEAINPPGAKMEPYRHDLAQVVQPPEPIPEPPVKPRRKSVTIRPQEPRPGTIRPGMIGPAPLVLVSEQRIDRTPPTGQPVVAVRAGRLSGAIGAGAAMPQPPRTQLQRPAAAPIVATDHDDQDDDSDDTITVDEAGFSDFAEKVGVKSMADMLEAAAAYATCIEQRDQFTRPQLMRRLIASAAGKPVSREEGLRSFGTLLRTGRIEKVSRGHYALPDNSPYLAEARRIAN